MSNTLKKMLTNIEQNKPINLSKFIELINSLNLGIRLDLNDIRATKVSANRYRIKSMPADLKTALAEYIKHIGDDRISSARQNLSHSHKVMGSYLLLLPDAHLIDKSQTIDNESLDPLHPIVVTIDADGAFTYPPSFKSQSSHKEPESNLKIAGKTVDKSEPLKDVVIIENRQLFLDFKRTDAFLKNFCQFESQNYDMIFGAGNDISNTLHQNFLSKYHKLYVLSDVDLGGVKIASNLLRLLPDSQIEFVMPHDIEKRLNNVSSRISSKDLSDIRQICGKHKELATVCQVITRTQKILEQESYLHDLI